MTIKLPQTQQMFKAIKALNHNGKPQNPKVLNENNQLTSYPIKILKITKDHYKDLFYNEDETVVKAFSGHPRL